MVRFTGLLLLRILVLLAVHHRPDELNPKGDRERASPSPARPGWMPLAPRGPWARPAGDPDICVSTINCIGYSVRRR